MLWSNLNDTHIYDNKDMGIAYLVAIPRKFWSIKEWILVNSFLKKIKGFLIE